METTRQFKIDFFCVTRNGERKHSALADLLKQPPPGGCTAAVSLEGESEKHQLRGIWHASSGKLVSAVFGRCRFDEQLTQGDEHGAEADVKLKPGHGLVEKNHLLFVPDRNLIVYQRNPIGSHHRKLQAYINKQCDGRFVLEPILQEDAYQKLLTGGEVKQVEVSFAAPADPDLYQDLLTAKAAAIVRESGAIRGHLKMSVGRSNLKMKPWIKQAVHSLARSGLASVAKVRLDDLEEPIDLIVNRLVKSASVPVGSDGKVASNVYFSALEDARSDASEALSAFFGT